MYFPIFSSGDNSFYYEKLVKMLVLAFVISGVMWTRWRIYTAVVTICLAFSFYGMSDGLKFLASGGGHKIVGNYSIGDNNHLALSILMTIPLLIYAYSYATVKFARVCYILVIIVCIVTVIGSYSRGGFVGLLVVGGMFLKNSKRKAGSFALIGLVSVLVFALAPETWFSRLNTINTANDDNSFIGRVVAWKISTLIALDRPFGGGFHAVQLYPVWTMYGGAIDSLGFIGTGPAGDYPKAAHSIYFEVLGDLGFVGLAIFLSLITVGFKNTMVLKRYARRDPRQRWAGDLGNAMQISLVVYCVSGALLSMAYFEALYILLILLSRTRKSVEALMAEEASAPSTRAGAGRMPPTQGGPRTGRAREHEVVLPKHNGGGLSAGRRYGRKQVVGQAHN